MVSVSIRPARFSYKLVLHSGEFTINIPRQSDLVAVKLCGESSGRQVDKFRELKLTPLPCPPLLSAPMIAESIISFGCRVRKDLPLGSHQLFIADIVSMYCEQDLMRGDGSVDPKAAEQLVWLDSAYWGLRKLE